MSANGIQHKPLDNDPILARAEMELSSPGNEIAQIMAQTGAACTGKNIMNVLAGMMVQGSGRGGGNSVTMNQGSSAGPAIGAGVAGIALGAAGAVGATALTGGGRGPVTPPKPTPASPPVTGATAAGSAAAPGSAGASAGAAVGQAAQTPTNQPAPNPEQLVTIGSQNQLGQTAG